MRYSGIDAFVQNIDMSRETQRSLFDSGTLFWFVQLSDICSTIYIVYSTQGSLSIYSRKKKAVIN